MKTAMVPRAAGVLAAVMVALAACSSSTGTEASRLATDSDQQVVHIVADDESWETSGISGLEAGWVTFTIDTVAGNADHGLALARLVGDATLDEALAAEGGDLAYPIGGLVGITGAGSHSVTVRLGPGSYGMFDIGGNDAGQNVERGMAASFEVAAGDGTAGAEPSSDGEIVMREYAIDVPEGFTGQGTYLVRNAGDRNHELNIGRVPEGANVAEEVRHDAETGESRIEEVPGLWIIDPGDAAYLTLDLDPGSYVFLCNLADPEDEPVHALQGMWAPFTVG